MPRRKAKKKARKPKPPSRRTRLVKWSVEVRVCDGNKCAVCGQTKFIQAHHLLPKERYPEYQFEPYNGVSLCPSHHKWGKLSAHRNPLWFAWWLCENRQGQYNWAMERIERKAA